MIIEDKSAESSALNEDFDIAIPFSVRLAAGESEPEITVYPSLVKVAREFLAKFTSPDEIFSRKAFIWARDALAPFLCKQLYAPDKEHEDYFIDFRLDGEMQTFVHSTTLRLEGGEDYENLTTYDIDALCEFGHIVYGEVLGGKIVSVAATNSPIFDDDEPDGIEIGVETAEGFEGRGAGTSVTAALALELERRGGYALFESESENHASLAVARKLGGAELARSFCIVGVRE